MCVYVNICVSIWCVCVTVVCVCAHVCGSHLSVCVCIPCACRLTACRPGQESNFLELVTCLLSCWASPAHFIFKDFFLLFLALLICGLSICNQLSGFRSVAAFQCACLEVVPKPWWRHPPLTCGCMCAHVLTYHTEACTFTCAHWKGQLL